jgi:hypothetical protein
MSRAEGVVAALLAAGKTGHAAEQAQARHPTAPSGEDLVGIGLVAHVPHQPVLGSIEHVMQGNGELDGAEVGGQVPAGVRDRFQHELPQLSGQPWQRFALQLPQLVRVVDQIKELVHLFLMGPQHDEVGELPQPARFRP